MKVKDLVNEIKETHKQVSSSMKDEIRVMQAMLNDTDYEVGVYGNAGQVGTYNPAKEFRAMQSKIIESTVKISKSEAENLVAGYEVTKSDAAIMVGISKEFINTYLDTGRKISLGGREQYSYTLASKDIPETEKTYQRRIANGNGNVTWEPGVKTIPAHKGLKAKSTCPSWVK